MNLEFFFIFASMFNSTACVQEFMFGSVITTSTASAWHFNLGAFRQTSLHPYNYENLHIIWINS